MEEALDYMHFPTYASNKNIVKVASSFFFTNMNAIQALRLLNDPLPSIAFLYRKKIVATITV